MRVPAALGLLVYLASTVLLSAQVQVAAQMERSSFLLYERVDLLVAVTNNSESELVLDNEPNHPWLSFLVTKHNHAPVRPERQAVFKPLTLKVGETKTLRVNLTPLFSFREEGDYTAAAVIELPGGESAGSQEVPFTVLRGRQIWSEHRPVDGSDRVYSLIRFSPKPDLTELYLRVEDPSENVVYANVGLGPIEAYIDPEVSFDPQGNLHVLHLLSLSHYLYTRADVSGKVVHQGVFKTYQEIPPRLAKMDDGSIFVNGGMEENATTQHESLAAGQSNALNAVKSPDLLNQAPSAGGSTSARGSSAPTPLPLPADTAGQTAQPPAANP
jgi:hypothetical protein